jgi:hypothetical protein
MIFMNDALRHASFFCKDEEDVVYWSAASHWTADMECRLRHQRASWNLTE